MYNNTTAPTHKFDFTRLVVIIPLLLLVNFFSGCFVNTFFKNTHTTSESPVQPQPIANTVAVTSQKTETDTSAAFVINSVYKNGKKVPITPGTHFRYNGHIYFALDEGLYVRNREVSDTEVKINISEHRINNKVM